MGVEGEKVSLEQALVAGGVETIWETWQGWVSGQRDEVNAAFDEEARAQAETPLGVGVNRVNRFDEKVAEDSQLWARARESREARREAELEKVEELRRNPMPLWRVISGLDGDEFSLRPGERAARIRKLLKGVERVARAELRAEETACKGDWRAEYRSAAEASEPNYEERDGRCFAWDPLRSICFYFGLAKTKLGAYAWEVWGLSAPQLVDRVKCEVVRGKVRAELKAFLLKYYAEHESPETEDVWDALRAVRKGISQRASLAARFGFSSYSRYFRACVLCYGVEPVELEREVLEEILKASSQEPGAVVKQREEVRNTKDEVREGELDSGGEMDEGVA